MLMDNDFTIWSARADAADALLSSNYEIDRDEADILKEGLVKEAIQAKRLDVLVYMLEKDQRLELAITFFRCGLLLKSPECAYLVHKIVDLSRMKDVFQGARSFRNLDGSEVENNPVYWQLWENYFESKIQDSNKGCPV